MTKKITKSAKKDAETTNSTKVAPILGSVAVVAAVAVAGIVGSGVFTAPTDKTAIDDQTGSDQTSLQETAAAQHDDDAKDIVGSSAELDVQQAIEIAVEAAEAKRLATIAEAEAEAQRLAAAAEAEAEAQRLAAAAEAEAEAQRLAAAAEAEAEAQRLAAAAEAEAEAQRLAATAEAEAEAQRLAGVAKVEAEAKEQSSDVFSVWSVELPFSGKDGTNVIANVNDDAPDWAREGARITAVNGTPIQKMSDISTVLRNAVEPTDGPRQTLKLTLQAPDSIDLVEHETEFPVIQETLLSNGAGFKTRFDGSTWKTEVAKLPKGESDFEVGDKVVALLDTQERIDGRTSLRDILKREGVDGKGWFNFAIARSQDGPLLYAAMASPKGS